MMRSLGAVGCTVMLVAACSIGAVPRSSSSASPSPSAPLPPLPNGYVRLTDRAGLVSFGVPRTWSHAFLDGKDPALTALEHADGPAAAFWIELASDTGDHRIVAARDPNRAESVAVAEQFVGVRLADPRLLDQALRRSVERAGVIRTDDEIVVDGMPGVRYGVELSRLGELPYYVEEAFDIRGALVDIGFYGPASLIAAITSTIHFGRG